MTSETQKALVIAAMLGVLFWFARAPAKKDEPVGADYPDAMVIVPPTGMGASVELDTWAEANNIELRRYNEGADLENVEPWIKDLYQATEGQRPAVAVRQSGKTIVLPIGDDILEKLKEYK